MIRNAGGMQTGIGEYNNQISKGLVKGHINGPLKNSGTKATENVGKFVEASDRESTLISKFDDKLLKRLEVMECQTCANRVYQDGSNDPGVSFKSPTHISPEQSGVMVASHEQEHVTRETSKAANEGREIISQSVRLFNGTCNECGKSYVSGGVTETTTANKTEQIPESEFVGNLVDIKL